MRLPGAVVLLVALAVAAGCSSGGDDAAAPAEAPATAPTPAAPTPAAPDPAPPPDPAVEPAPAAEPPPAAGPAPKPAPPAAPAAAVVCEDETYPSQVPLEGTTHFEELPDGFEYNSTPASQGPHHPQWLVWNWYDVPVPEINKVHNLEHGGIAVQWGDQVPDQTVAQIREWYSEDPNAIVAAPLPELGDRIALSAWFSERSASTVAGLYEESTGHIRRCSGFDRDAFQDFKDTYRGHGPEAIPVRILTPGSAEA